MNELTTLGAIVLWAGGDTPEGWLDCDGRLLQAEKHEALYALVGWKYGCKTENDFNLPKLDPVGTARYIICVDRSNFPTQP